MLSVRMTGLKDRGLDWTHGTTRTEEIGKILNFLAIHRSILLYGVPFKQFTIPCKRMTDGLSHTLWIFLHQQIGDRTSVSRR